MKTEDYLQMILWFISDQQLGGKNLDISGIYVGKWSQTHIKTEFDMDKALNIWSCLD